MAIKSWDSTQTNTNPFNPYSSNYGSQNVAIAAAKQNEQKQLKIQLANQRVAQAEKASAKQKTFFGRYTPSVVVGGAAHALGSTAANIAKSTATSATRAGTELEATPLNPGIKPQDLIENAANKVQSQALKNGASKKDAQALGDTVRNKGYTQLLDKAGIGQNDSKFTVGRKTVGNIGGTASLLIPGSQAVKEGSLLPRVLKGAAGGATASGTSNLASEKVTPKNEAVAIGAGAVLGGGAPILGQGVRNILGRNQAVKDLITNTKTADALNKSTKASKTSDVGKVAVKETNGAPTSPVKANISSSKPIVEKGAPSIVPLNEAGSVPVGEIVGNVQDMLAKHQTVAKATGDVSEDYSKLQGNTKDIKLDTAKVLKNRTQLSRADKQTLQDYRDSKAAGLTPQKLPAHLQQADEDITNLNKAAQAADAEKARMSGNEAQAQKIEARNPITYTHRIAQGKGSNLELTARGDTQNPLSVGSLSKTTAGSKKQTFLNATDEAGNRRTVAVKNGKVTALDGEGKNAEDLGNLNLKTNADKMQKDLDPIQRQIDNLEKEKQILSKVKTKGGVSQARVRTLNSKAVEAFNKQGERRLPKNVRRQANRSFQHAILKSDELRRVKAPGTNAPTRLETINSKLLDLHRKYADVLNEHDLNDLQDKTFKGKDGKTYKLGQATQSEITKNTGQKYYVDPELTSHLNYADSKVALENTRFVENTKKVLEDKDVAYKEGETAPKGFRTTTNPYFRGYKLDPKVAEVLDDIGGKSHSVAGNALGAVSRFLRQTIVYLPLKHDLNELSGYFVDRGLTKWLNPVATGRMVKSLGTATKEVIGQGPIYRKMLKEGSTLMTADDKQLGKVVAKQVKDLTEDQNKVKQLAISMGTSPKRMYQALQKVTVWDVQDILNVARVQERMKGTMFSKGMSFEDAVKATEKTNFQYKVPSRVALPGKLGRAASEGLRSDKVYFGAYTYDKYRIAKNILKGTANLKNPKEALRSADQLAATIAIAAVLWPLVDKGLQKVTGDKNAHITAPGVASVAELAKKEAQHKAGVSDVTSQISVSAPYSLGSQLYTNKNAFDGSNIADPNADLKDKTKQRAWFLVKQLAPNQKLSTVKNASENKTLSTALGLAGASLPKNSPTANKLNSLKFETLPSVQEKARTQGGKHDFTGAAKTISDYNQKVLALAKQDLKDNGQKVPADKVLEAQLKKGGYYYQPKASTVKNWAKPKSTPKGAFAP